MTGATRGCSVGRVERPLAEERPTTSFRVLIAGGGVAALEGLLALRALAGNRVDAHLFAPDPVFRYRPLSVTEPFALGTPRNLDLAEITLGLGATFLHDALAAVDAERQRVTTSAGRELDYDALLIAVGARAGVTIPGAVAFWDSADRGAFGELLGELEHGAVKRLVFAVPSDVSWPLGLYELALLSRARARELGLEDVELTLVTPESRPMSVFGERASTVVGELMSAAGVTLRLSAKPTGFVNGKLAIEGQPAIACDRVVSLPVPEVAPIAGTPQDHDGFLPVDRFGGVLGLEHVYAAGDATQFPIKQGGIATQAADSAASAIAALAGAAVEPQPFQPVLRGALLTESGPRYLRAPSPAATGTAARSFLWWPPAKIAGKYLAPYLAARAGYKMPDRMLTDLEPPPGEDATAAGSGHEDVVALTLSSAEANASERDFRRALRWLEIAEDLELYLPRDYELKRIAWQELARSQD